MKTKLLTFLILTVITCQAQEGIVEEKYSLDTMIHLAIAKSTSTKIAQSTKENKFYAFKSYKSGLKPQLGLDGNLANYSRDFLGVVQPDGSIIFQPRTQNYSNIGLSLSQQIGATGGTLAVSSYLTRFDDFNLNEKQYSGIPINISLAQPLFGFNDLKWEKKIEPLKYQQAEKDFNLDISNISLQTTKLFFDVIDAQVNFELASKNLENLNIIFDIEKKRVDLGTTTKDKMLQIELQLLKSQQEVANADVKYKSSLFNLKSFIGINDNVLYQLLLPSNVPEIKITLEKAIEEERKNRAEFVGFVVQRLQAERDLKKAEKARFTINLAAAFGFNNIGNNLGSIYKDPYGQQSMSLGVKIPILDWGRNKDNISLANTNLKTVKYTIEQQEVVLIQEINNLVTTLKLISKNIYVAKRTDDIASERYNLLNEQYKFGKITITDLNIALSEKDDSRRNYITALRDFWESYYQLKTLTLSDI